jgi:formate C-acetyltransferase
MTPRTEALRERLWNRACENRKDDWIDKSGLPDLSKPLSGHSELEPVMIRRARGIAAVLDALTDPERAKRTNSFVIAPGELLVGVLPMGSNGLGKIFPDYLAEDERHIASIANRSELSVVGHNVADYQRLVKKGIRWILDFCNDQIQRIGPKPAKDSDVDRLDFYRAVIISCEAVVEYARRFADLAAKMAKTEPNAQRREELLEIERICRKVPMQPAETFHEALQSILFLQIGIRAGMDLMSLGRLDQTLQPYLERNAKPSAADLAKAVELVECFVVKLAGPLNLSTEYLLEQDHIDYGISMSIHRWYTDQRGNVNQFLQNVVVGGKTADGADATVDCTHVLVQAWANVNLPTPGLYVRLHKHTPAPLLERVAAAIARTGSLPAVLNDDVIIPGLVRAMIEDKTMDEHRATRLANDYCVDGCWEPILNGQCDWTFNMINGLTVLECALNEGATLDANPMYLRGNKLCYRTPPVGSYEDLKRTLKTSMEFFVFQSVASMYNYYLVDEFVTPSPLFSAFLGTCLERGRDKSWGGSQLVFGATVLGGLPNMVNSIVAIRKWVFENRKYKLDDVLGAFRNNFKAADAAPEKQAIYSDIHADFFCHSPRFGNNDQETNDVARLIAGYFAESVARAKKFADEVYRFTPTDPEKAKHQRRLRMTAGYYGPSLEDHLEKKEITIAFTAGLGTFATYALMGQQVAASADRLANEPLAMNNTPTPGTVARGYGHTLATLKSLDLGRFAAGAPLDLCLELEGDGKEDVLREVIRGFLRNNGNVLSMTLGSTEQYREIYDLAVRASKGEAKAASDLLNWGHVIVRAGGWQTPFITMTLAQQEHYTRAAIAP